MIGHDLTQEYWYIIKWIKPSSWIRKIPDLEIVLIVSQNACRKNSDEMESFVYYTNLVQQLIDVTWEKNILHKFDFYFTDPKRILNGKKENF